MNEYNPRVETWRSTLAQLINNGVDIEDAIVGADKAVAAFDAKFTN